MRVEKSYLYSSNSNRSIISREVKGSQRFQITCLYVSDTSFIHRERYVCVCVFLYIYIYIYIIIFSLFFTLLFCNFIKIFIVILLFFHFIIFLSSYRYLLCISYIYLLCISYIYRSIFLINNCSVLFLSRTSWILILCYFIFQDVPINFHINHLC